MQPEDPRARMPVVKGFAELCTRLRELIPGAFRLKHDITCYWPRWAPELGESRWWFGFAVGLHGETMLVRVNLEAAEPVVQDPARIELILSAPNGATLDVQDVLPVEIDPGRGLPERLQSAFSWITEFKAAEIANHLTAVLERPNSAA